jgi:hypothetical protein
VDCYLSIHPGVRRPLAFGDADDVVLPLCSYAVSTPVRRSRAAVSELSLPPQASADEPVVGESMPMSLCGT